MRYLDWFGDGSVAVLDLALACCAVETEAAMPRVQHGWDEPPSEAKIVVTVSGTLSNVLAPRVAEVIQAQPRTPTVVAFGACACAGGPYWDSYSVTKGADQVAKVDHYIAGCPPPPEALTEILRQVRDD